MYFHIALSGTVELPAPGSHRGEEFGKTEKRDRGTEQEGEAAILIKTSFG